MARSGQACYVPDLAYSDLEHGVYKYPTRRSLSVCLQTDRALEARLAPLTHVRQLIDPPCLPSVGATLMGPAASLGYVCNTCIHNAHNALCTRHGIAAPPVTSDLVHATAFAEALSVLLRTSLADCQSHMDGWLAKWPRAKQKCILQSDLADPVLYSQVRSFVKREVGLAYPTKARLIQGLANLATQYSTGPPLYAIQKALTPLVQNFRFGSVDVTFASGMDAAALGAWMDRALAAGYTHAIECDGKAWDATMQREHLELRLAVYAAYGPDVVDFVRRGFTVEGRVYTRDEGFLSYHLNGTVKSGHGDTTLGNNIVNACIAVETCLRLGLEASIIVAGDDLLVMSRTPVTVEEWDRLHSQCGVRPETAVFADYRDASFISGVFVPTPSGVAFCPKIGRLLAKLSWTVNPPPTHLEAAWRRGVALGLYGTAEHLPLIRVVLNRWLRKDIEAYHTDKYEHWAYHGISQPLTPDATLDWFCERYNVTPGEVAEAERFLNSIPIVCVYRHPIIDRILAVDLADAPDRPVGMWDTSRT